MTRELKLLFDECVGRPVMARIVAAARARGQESGNPHPFECKHVLDFQGEGVHDDVWIPQIAAGGWVLLTADRGKKGRREKGDKLPLVCKRCGVTFVLLSSSLHKSSSSIKAQAILSVWEQLLRVPEAPRGTAFLIRRAKPGPFQLVNLDEEQQAREE